MAREISAGIERAYYERTDLLVVALTGRTGSGCTTTAQVFTKNYSDLVVSESEQPRPEDRKLAIAKSFLHKNWVPFKVVTVSTVILSYLLECEEPALRACLKRHKTEESAIVSIVDELGAIKSNQYYPAFIRCISEGDKEQGSAAWIFYEETLSPSASRIRDLLGVAYAPLFQEMCDNIRFSGSALSNTINLDELFSLVRKVKRLIKAAFKHDRGQSRHSTRIVVDAIRNPLELLYLRDQFSAFYAIAITSDDEHRIARLEARSLLKRDIAKIDAKEASGKKSLRAMRTSYRKIFKSAYRNPTCSSQTMGSEEFATNIRGVHAQVLRYTALMLRPGLITPTRDERCMQLAFVAKVNSGCISRQVGATVADEGGSIKAVGWNDVPRGQVPCLLRDVGELISGGDTLAFSHYERTDPKLKRHLETEFSQREALKTASGLSCPYCFKDAYNAINNDENNQVHTRALHAEENAFLQLAKYGNSGIQGGVLYTTASPCELCSKKAFQLGIKEVIYIDPYPGISSSHILQSGDESMRPKLRLFNGAIGHAYHRLYEAILPIKDEYRARLSTDPQQDLL